MIERSFLDTNVLVYAFDEDSPEKQKRAQLLLERAAVGQAWISPQVLQEFYVATTRKLARPLTHEDAERAVAGLAALPVVSVDDSSVRAAIARVGRLSISLWDAMIVQAAVEGGCRVLLTEDMQHDQEIDGVRISNPFRG